MIVANLSTMLFAGAVPSCHPSTEEKKGEEGPEGQEQERNKNHDLRRSGGERERETHQVQVGEAKTPRTRVENWKAQRLTSSKRGGTEVQESQPKGRQERPGLIRCLIGREGVGGAKEQE